jgi:hypothetical protein
MTVKRLLRCTLVPVALCGFLLLPGTGRANITFQLTSPGSVSTTTNVGAYAYDPTDPTDKSVFGENLNQNQVLGQNTNILKVVADQALTINGNGGGQAYLSATSAPIGMIDVTPVNPPLVGFTTLEFNPMSSSGLGHMYLVATDQFGTTFTSQTFEYDSTGQNRVAALASGNEYITDVKAYFAPPAADLKQFRLNYELGNPSAVPEPSTMALALSGLVGAGLAGLRRLRRRQAATE